jgi:glycerol kinase
MDARGALLGLTRGAGRAHLARAVLESIAYQSRDVFEAMKLDSGIELNELRVDGGASRNSFLMQFQADILNVTVDRPKIVETTAVGAAFLAGLATGVWSGPSELDSIRRTDCRFEPDMDESQREALCAGWLNALNRVSSDQPG